jgi:hypothetical protein
MKRAADYDAVLETLQRYIEGTFKGDVDKLRTAFHPKAVLSGYIHVPQAPPEGVLFVDGIESLYGHMAASPSPEAQGDAYAARIGAVEVHGELAHAVVYEDGLFGHDFVNHLNLHRTAEGWRITAKAFSGDR